MVTNEEVNAGIQPMRTRKKPASLRAFDLTFLEKGYFSVLLNQSL
jgi:hypothetical protein